MAIAPPQLVQGTTASPLPFGLFSVVPFRPEGDSRWSNGIEFEVPAADAVEGIGQYDDDPGSVIGLPKDLSKQGPDLGEGSPFTVYGRFVCGALGFPVAEAQRLALGNLLAGEQRRVEQAFWTGDLDNTPALEDVGTTTLTVAASRMRSGLALLEEYAGSTYGAQGVIHMPRGLATHMAAKGYLTMRGQVLLSPLGTPVVAGAGYPGTGPTGQAVADEKGWVYITPSIFGYRSEVFTSSRQSGDLFDRSTNDLIAIAERTYLFGFDPTGVAAVLVDPLI